MNTLTKLLLTIAPSALLLLTACGPVRSVPGYHHYRGGATDDSVNRFHAELFDALYPLRTHAVIVGGDQSRNIELDYREGSFKEDEAAFNKGLKLVFPEYEKHTQQISYRGKPAELIRFPPEECASAILIKRSSVTSLVTGVEFIHQDGAAGKCEKQSKRAENARQLQFVDIKKVLEKNGFKGEPPLCSTIPKKHMTITKPVTKPAYISWNVYSQGFCYSDDSMLIHYFYQTPKQIRQDKAEQRRIDRDNYEADQRERERRLADPMYDFTVEGPRGKTLHCGRDTPDSPVHCR
jgi:hypothetical protein